MLQCGNNWLIMRNLNTHEKKFQIFLLLKFEFCIKISLIVWGVLGHRIFSIP